MLQVPPGDVGELGLQLKSHPFLPSSSFLSRSTTPFSGFSWELLLMNQLHSSPWLRVCFWKKLTLKIFFLYSQDREGTVTLWAHPVGSEPYNQTQKMYFDCRAPIKP